MTQGIEKLFGKVEQIAQKLQRHYFDNERFFDLIDGAESLDNTSGWTYDLWFALEGRMSDEGTRETFKWAYNCFDGIARLMERNGAGANGGARGINENVQYAWAISYRATRILRDIAKQLSIEI